MRKIIYSLSAFALAFAATTMDASAKKERSYEDDKRHHHKTVRYEKKVKYGAAGIKIIKKTVIHKPGGKKVVRRVVKVVSQPQYRKRKAAARRHHRAQARYGYKPAAKRISKVTYRRGPADYKRIVVAPHKPRRHRHQSSYYREPSLPVLAMQMFLQMTHRQLEMQRRAMARAVSADIDEPIRWNDNGMAGATRTTREGTDSYGRVCREFQQTIEIGDNFETAYGVACRNRDGDWDMLP